MHGHGGIGERTRPHSRLAVAVGMTMAVHAVHLMTSTGSTTGTASAAYRRRWGRVVWRWTCGDSNKRRA